MNRRHRLQLLTVLLVTSLVMGLIGGLLRRTVCKDITQLQGVPAPAVPLMLLADPTLLQAASMEQPGTETLSKPGTVPPVTEQEPQTPEGEPEQPEGDSSRVPELPTTTEPEDEAEAPAAEDPAAEESTEPAWQTVSEDWFDDALFIGDSRTVGLSQYGRLGGADYFADTGMTVFNVLSEKASDQDFSSQTLEELLTGQTYGKIYLMLGINEIGYPFSSLITQYQTVLETLRTLQPETTIFLCANLHVTRSAAAATPRLEPDNIALLDGQIAEMADGRQVFFLDVNPEFCDEEGYLRDDLTGDGVHPYGTGYEVWAQWLQAHGLS